MSDDVVLAYTDGSAIKQIKDKTKYHGGAGVILIYKGKEKRISTPIEDGTNNISEITAAILALQALKKPCKIKIVTDSQYVINGATKWGAGWVRRGWKTAAGEPVKNAELFKQLLDLCKVHDVTWEWVKGHNGDEMNEVADQLACQASAKLKELEEKSL